jgi:small ligand-binding sensory domain FIST
VTDQTIVTTAIQFKQTQIRGGAIALQPDESSFAAGDRLGRLLEHRVDQLPLTHVFVLSDGLQINGSDLVRGMEQTLPLGVHVTGGMAGNGGARGQSGLSKLC